MGNIAQLEGLTFLDISYCKEVTDAGLAHFTGKTYPLDTLIINAVNGISGAGLKQWLHSFKDTLLDFEAALNDQESFNSSFFEVLGQCWNLETLDVTGSKGIDDEGGRLITAQSVTYMNETIKPGLQYCHTLKINGSTISDATLPSIIKAMPDLQHIELCKCEAVGEFGINSILQNCPNLIYLDLNKVPVATGSATYGFLDELKKTNPDLLIRRNVHVDDDFKKDNGLRVPRRIVEKKKKKKKKKGKKKK